MMTISSQEIFVISILLVLGNDVWTICYLLLADWITIKTCISALNIILSITTPQILFKQKSNSTF